MSHVLVTSRLNLRPLEAPRDLDFLAALLAHPQVMAHWPAPLSREEAGAWIDKQLWRYERDGCGYWMVELRATGAPIGQAGIMFIDIDGAREAGLGYMIHTDHWGRGHGTEAARACVEWAFEMLGVPRVVAPVRPANAASIRVAEKIGMTPAWTTMFAGFEHIIYVLHAGQA
jgi:RimJ/RimL family protein N-acetyltransferase